MLGGQAQAKFFGHVALDIEDVLQQDRALRASSAIKLISALEILKLRWSENKPPPVPRMCVLSLFGQFTEADGFLGCDIALGSAGSTRSPTRCRESVCNSAGMYLLVEEKAQACTSSGSLQKNPKQARH